MEGYDVVSRVYKVLISILVVQKWNFAKTEGLNEMVLGSTQNTSAVEIDRGRLWNKNVTKQ
jgi:hypothetical protein